MRFKDKFRKLVWVICSYVGIMFILSMPGFSLIPMMVGKAIAAEVSAEEQTTMSEDIQRALEEDDFVSLEEIKGDLSEGILKAENQADEIRATLPSDIDLSGFESRFSEKMSKIENLILGIDQFIYDPSSENQDNVLGLVEALDPEPQGEILAAKLPLRVVPAAVVKGKRPLKTIDLPPVPEDVLETKEIQFTPELRALMENENIEDPVDWFTYLRNNFHYVPYPGARQSVNQTIENKSGSDVDLATLMIAGLRSMDHPIPSRYVMGLVDLSIGDAMNWVGVETLEAAVEVFERNGLLNFGGEVIYKNGEISAISFWHTWVSLYDGHQWRKADPSFKELIEIPGTKPNVELDQEYIQSLVSSEGNSLLIDSSAMSALFAELSPKFEGVEISRREIVPMVRNNTQPYLAAGIKDCRKPTEEHNTLSEEFKYFMKVVLPGGVEFNTTLSEIGNRSVSLHYDPATPGDRAIIEYYGGIFNVPLPSLTVQMVPVVSVDGVIVATGSATGLGLSNQAVKVGFLRAGWITWEWSNKPLGSGNHYDICVSTHTSLESVRVYAEKLGAEAIGQSPEDVMTDNQINKSLHFGGLFYFGMVDYFSQAVSPKVVAVNHVSLGFVCKEIKPVYLLWWLWSLVQGGAHIDVVRSLVCPVSKTGNPEEKFAWMGMRGFIGTSMESGMLEVLYGLKGDGGGVSIEAVSTGRIFYEASQRGIRIIRLDNPDTLEAVLATVSAHKVVKDHIRSHVKAGYVALIPQYGVTIGGWSGQGWMVINPISGAAGYMICGSLHNIINGGSSTGVVHDLVHLFHHIMNIGHLLTAPGGILSMALGAMLLGYLLLSSFGWLAAIPFFGAGVVFYYVAVWSFVQIMSNYLCNCFGWCLRRRQKQEYPKLAYAYV